MKTTYLIQLAIVIALFAWACSGPGTPPDVEDEPVVEGRIDTCSCFGEEGLPKCEICPENFKRYVFLSYGIIGGSGCQLPVTCFPEIPMLLEDVRINIFNDFPDETFATIETLDGELVGSLDPQFGGRNEYIKKGGFSEFRFGLVEEKFLDQDLVLIVKTATVFDDPVLRLDNSEGQNVELLKFSYDLPKGFFKTK